ERADSAAFNRLRQRRRRDDCLSEPRTERGIASGVSGQTCRRAKRNADRDAWLTFASCAVAIARLTVDSPCLLPQPMIDQDQRHHRFAHWDESRQQARVVPTLHDDLRRLAGPRDGLLRLRQAAGWLDRNSANDRHAARDAA